MSWNVLTAFTLGLSGFLALLVMLGTSLLRQLPELVCAWRSLRTTTHTCPRCPDGQDSGTRSSSS
ncbi:hypothetical protein ACFU8I_39850 [Streptomyces sp. NPDC057540]|uniref:hypothetical protein n=1 Tax=Streptomyces sp. NPDC057540 TaxID=3346160 RepID=UPI00367F8402